MKAKMQHMFQWGQETASGRSYAMGIAVEDVYVNTAGVP
jgi:hypothetical protein